MEHHEWLAWRQRHLGASEAHIFCEGSLEEVRRLWAQKRGSLEPDDLGNLGKIGLALEPIIKDCYEKESGRTVLPADPVEHFALPFLSCTPDGVTTGGQPGRVNGLYEAKSVSGPVLHDIKLNGLPRRHYWQLVAGMEVCGLDWAAIAVLDRDGGRFFTFDLPADKHLAGIYKQRGAELWRCITEGVDPEESPLFGEEARAERKEVQLPDVGGSLQILTDEDSARAFEALRAARAAKAEIENLHARARAGVERVMKMGGASIAECAGLRVYWQDQGGRRVIDEIKLAELAAKHGLDLSGCYKTTAGSRPFRVYEVGGENV